MVFTRFFSCTSTTTRAWGLFKPISSSANYSFRFGLKRFLSTANYIMFYKWSLTLACTSHDDPCTTGQCQQSRELS